MSNEQNLSDALSDHYWMTIITKHCFAVLGRNCPQCGLSFADDARPVVEGVKVSYYGRTCGHLLLVTDASDLRLLSSEESPVRNP